MGVILSVHNIKRIHALPLRLLQFMTTVIGLNANCWQVDLQGIKKFCQYWNNGFFVSDAIKCIAVYSRKVNEYIKLLIAKDIDSHFLILYIRHDEIIMWVQKGILRGLTY